VTEEGRLLTPHELFRSTKDVFISWNSYNHHGYAFDEIDGDFVVRHVGREVPCYRDYNALFFHNIEPGNYGSFVLRQLPQMILARTKSLECDCYIVAERLPWVADALRLLGFPDKPMFSVPEISGDQFRSITLCGDCDAEGFTSPETRRKFKDILRESQSLVLPADGPKRIYVSRSLSALARPDYRVMRNQQEIERWLSSRGFTIIYPEILSFAAQMRIFYNAQYIVGPSGSGMFNILFAESPRKVLDIETFHVTVRQHAKFYASCGAKYSFLFCRPETDANPDLIACPYTLPVPLLDEALHWLLEDEDFGE
jgi:capsular polysaccharide biosynthesis protein